MKKLFYFTWLVLLIAAGSSIARATTFTVTKIADTNDGVCDADCSLRETISAANAAASDDVIVFDTGVFGTLPQTITLSGTPLIIADNGSLTIIGTRPDLLTISGNNLSRVFVIHSAAIAAISNITITGGNAGSSDGGGIANIGTSTITNCIVRNNQSGNGGGGLVNINPGTLNIINSTIYGNTAVAGGGIYNSRFLTVTNSTIANNIASSSGGGIYAIDNPSSMSLFSTTIAFNSAQLGGGGVVVGQGTLTARNTIFAKNTDFFSPDLSGTLNSQGYNLIQNTDGTTIVGTTTGNILGADPSLAATLAMGDGLTPTLALLCGSPAIDTAHPTDFPGNDQRGIGRPKDGNADGILRADIGAFERFAVIDNSAPFDFDGDGRTDISIFRPSAGEWWILKSSNGGNAAFQFGNSSDKIVPADFTGDGTTDVAIFRPSTGEWFILRSENQSYYSFPFGTNGDIPAPADYDGDNKSDAAVFRPSTATWFILRSSGGTTIQQFGANGDAPVVADYDGDSKSDIAIYRPSAGEWWIQRSSNNSVLAFTFGNSSDKAVQGDYTGDGKADAAIFRPSTGEWFVLRSENQSYYSFPFGTTGDLPAPGDFDGDGKFDAAVFRPSSTTWFVQRTTAGTLIQQFGIAGDAPVPSAFIP